MAGHRKRIASITIPLRGNEQTRKAINELAEQESKYVADLVFDAIHSVYGKRFEGLLETFDAKHGYSNDRERTT